MQAAIVANDASAGFDCVAERHLELQDNFSFAEVDATQIRRLVHEVAQSRPHAPQAIVILCTSLRGAPLVDALERETGILVPDSVATVVWKALRLAGIDTRRLSGWGRLFDEGE